MVQLILTLDWGKEILFNRWKIMITHNWSESLHGHGYQEGIAKKVANISDEQSQEGWLE